MIAAGPSLGQVHPVETAQGDRMTAKAMPHQCLPVSLLNAKILRKMVAR
jgi:hypothetical protein